MARRLANGLQQGLSSGGYEIFTHNGTQSTGLHPVDVAKRAEALGAGEVVVNSIDRDGVMDGYDLELITQVREAISLPMTVLGGAGSRVRCVRRWLRSLRAAGGVGCVRR